MRISIVRQTLLLLVHFGTLHLATSQVPDFENYISASLDLSEQALFDARFDEAFHYIDDDHFQKFEAYNAGHRALLAIQSARVGSFKARLYQSPYASGEHFMTLRGMLATVENLDTEYIKADYFVSLSSFYRSRNLDSCIYFENRALEIFANLQDDKSAAELRATRIFRMLDTFFSKDMKSEALELIPAFREEIEFSSKHSKYALAYNTRHLANIYRIYEGDLAEALRLYQQSLSLREEIGFRPFIPASHYSVGETYLAMGKTDLAIQAYTRAVKYAGEVGFVRYTITPLIRIGDAHAQAGNAASADRYYRDALVAAAAGNYSAEGIDNLLEKLTELKSR